MPAKLSLGSFMASNSSKRGDGFIECARLIAGENPSRGLVKYLRDWSSSVMLDIAVQSRQPSKAEVYARLKKLIANVEAALQELRDPAVVAFLNFADLEPIPIPAAGMEQRLQRWSVRITLLGSIPPAGGLELSIKLFKLVEGIELIRRELEQPALTEFLEIDDPGPLPTASLVSALKEIAGRAQYALSSPCLVDKTGHAKSGSGRALPPMGSSPRAFCAAVIIEAWTHAHDGNCPAPSNEGLAKAANEYWQACGGVAEGWGDTRLKSWRPYFRQAATPPLAKIRKELRRYILLTVEFDPESTFSPPQIDSIQLQST